MKFEDLTGETFGKWKVLGCAAKGSATYWNCRCGCGTESTIRAGHLKSGKSTQCVKCRGKVAEVVNRKHGRSTRKEGITPEYRAWSHMKDRCTNTRHEAFQHYGGRQIDIYPAWINSFQAFYDYVGPRPSPRHTLERIRNGEGYQPGNVRWATRRDQANNRRSNRIVTIDGVSGTLRQLCERFELDHNFMRSRVQQREGYRKTAQESADAYRLLQSV